MRAGLSRRRLRSLIVLGGVMLVLSFAGSAFYDGWRLHQQLLVATDRELGNIAKALADEAAQNLRTVDLLLRDTALWYENDGQRMEPAAVQSVLALRGSGVQQVSVLTIVDAKGMQRYRSRNTGEPLADVSDRPYFTTQRERPTAGLYINEPILTRTERLPAVVISRRLNGPGGAFEGVVTAIVTLKHMDSTYAAIELGEGSSLLLTLNDGTLVVRQPSMPELEGRMKFPEFAALKGGRLVDRLVSPMDGRRKLVAAVGVGDEPLVLAVTRDEEVALGPWRDEVRSGAIRSVIVALLVGLTTLALLWQLRRLELGERALGQSEERYAMAMEAANEGHAEWNIPQATAFTSDRWRVLHGMKPGDSTQSARTLLDQVDLHLDDVEGCRVAVRDHLEGRTSSIEVEYRVRQSDGEWHWIHARGRCLLDGDHDDAPLRLFCSAIDVTERKAAELAKLDLAIRLQQNQRLEALGTLAGGIAHDFNNILGAILGFGEMAQMQAAPGSPMRRHLDRVMQAGARAKLLVRRILDFSRSGVAERSPVNMQMVVEEVIAMLSPTLPSEMQLKAELECGNAAVIGDATQLYQVVMNLCTNAVHAMQHGTVRVHLRCVDTRSAGVDQREGMPGGVYVRLDVIDGGSGIPVEVQQKMFDPFFTTKNVGEGTGLGLSVVHGIVSNLGGAIDVASNARGTKVSVWLPAEGQSNAEIPARLDDFPRGQGQAIMIIDDEQPVLELVEELLASLGYEPVGFASAEKALAAFEDDPARFDAVMSDEMLPGMAGSDLARLILGTRPTLPFILMSGKVTLAVETRAAAAGVCVVLHKPLGLREMAEQLARCLIDPRAAATATVAT